MKAPVALRTGNLMFIRISVNNTFIPESLSSPKYMAVIPYNGLLMDNIFTLAEIKAKYPDVNEFSDITEAK